ncbi:MAG: hypothetical protein QOK40_2015 [Miltoncostaeaceae bacterium]|nr:hypothetical protein [Miltoncostaeaceae bacterium]
MDRIPAARRLALPLLAAGLVLGALAPSAMATSTAVLPVADSYVNADLPSSNYGTAMSMRVDVSPVTNGYLRFDVQTNGEPVGRATLWLYAASASTVGYRVGSVADTTWGEKTLTAANAPAIAPTEVGHSGAFAAGAWTRVDVTPLVAGSGLVSFGMTTTTSTAMGLSSREVAAQAPQLVLETDTTAPSAPTGLSAAVVDAHAIALSWTAAQDDFGVTGYRVYRDAGAAPIASISGAATGYTDTGLATGSAHTYRVAAVDAAGHESAPSDPANAGTGGDTTPPSVPTGLTAIAPDAHSIGLLWTAATDDTAVAGYRVFRDGGASPIAGVDAATTGYTDLGLAPAAGHSYAVAAVDAAGNQSALSATASGATAADTTLPGAPASLSATAAGPSRIDLSWPAASDDTAVTAYLVYRDGGATPIATVGAAATGYADTTLSQGTTHSYTVAAGDAAGNVSARSASASATTTASRDTSPPTAPAKLSARAQGAHAIALTWKASKDDVGVAGYRVFGDGAVPIATLANVTGYTDSGLAPRTSSSYTVAAVDAAGNQSPRSAPAAATTAADTTGPTAPTGVQASALDAHRIGVTWTASTDDTAVTSYRIFRDGSATALATLAGTATGYTDSGLAPQGAHSYTVAAFDAAGNRSVASPAASASTAADTTAPTVPAGVTATALDAARIAVGWTASGDDTAVTGYLVYRDGVPAPMATLGPSATSFTDSGLALQSTHSYAVSAVDAAGNQSAPSAPATATTPADTGIPTVPGGVSAFARSQSQVSVGWQPSTDPSGIASYRVFRDGSLAATVASPLRTYVDQDRAAQTVYTYAVIAVDTTGQASDPSSPVSVSTPAPLVGDPVIAAAGDIACDPGNSRYNGGAGDSTNCRQGATADLLQSMNPTAVLALGDVQYYCGGYNAFLASYMPSWGRLGAITDPVIGNHEHLTAGGSEGGTGCDSTNAGAAGFYRYFGAAAGDPSQGYYSYDLGSWHIIALNTNCTPAGGCSARSPQGRWLAADLAAHQNMCTLAYWHTPLFSSGGRADATYKVFWDALYAAGADVVLNGHDHLYERFAPQDPAGVADAARGMRQWVVGTGGANHTSVTAVFANSEVRNADTFGVLKLTLHPTGYDWQFVPEAGKTFGDAGTASCH